MKQSFLDKHGARIGLAIYCVSGLFMFSLMVFLTVIAIGNGGHL